MHPTYLKYLEYGTLLHDQAKVLEIFKTEDGKTSIILDQTIFYPQGGGQPFDQGTIKNEDSIFRVQEVRFKDGIVYHFGTFESGNMYPNETVKLMVDKPHRQLHSKIHSAGHLVDIAFNNLGYVMKPSRGYHFPKGAYVEYEGTLDEEVRQNLLVPLENEINKIVQTALPISIKILSVDELKKISSFVPENIPTNKPTRAMIVESYPAIPCGGTHVQNTKDVGRITIDKIKNKKGNLRISYSVT